MKGRIELRARGPVITSIAVFAALAFFPNQGNVATVLESDAIGGTGIDAIGGTGIDAIGGTGIDAIGGTGIDAIGGTGIDAIGGTGRTAKRRYSDAIGGTGIDAIGGTGRVKNVVLQGPVQRADLAANTVTVFERELRLSADQTRRISEAIAGGQTVVLAIYGRVASNGVIKSARATVTTEQYAAGSSPVVLTGRVSSVDTSIGHAIIGRQVVDLTAAQASGDLMVRAGDVIAVFGTQATLGGSISAQIVSPAD